MTIERLITDWRPILLFAIIAGTSVNAQEAVLSFKAVKVNDDSIPATNTIQVVPGDIIEVEIFLSDWSPDGERLESWSVRIEPDGFSSGRIGYVYLPGYVPWYCPFAECGSDGECFPVGLKCVNGCCYGPEIHDNVFIDMTRKDYVFAGLDSSPYVQPLIYFYTDSVSTTVAPTYEQSPKYCGTFILTSSDDACGTFTITKASSALNLFSGSDSITIEVVFEPLTVDVPGDCPLPHPQDSYIQNCSTYPQSWTEPDGSNPSNQSNFLLIFDGSTGGITELDLLATSIPAGEPVEIISMQLYREQWLLTLELDRDFPAPGEWGCITYLPYDETVCVGSLPGDVNGNGTVETDDLLILIDNLNSDLNPRLDTLRCNIDRSRRCGPSDILRVIDLFAGAEAYQPWLGQGLPPCPSAP